MTTMSIFLQAAAAGGGGQSPLTIPVLSILVLIVLFFTLFSKKQVFSKWKISNQAAQSIILILIGAIVFFFAYYVTESAADSMNSYDSKDIRTLNILGNIKIVGIIIAALGGFLLYTNTQKRK